MSARVLETGSPRPGSLLSDADWIRFRELNPLEVVSQRFAHYEISLEECLRVLADLTGT